MDSSLLDISKDKDAPDKWGEVKHEHSYLLHILQPDGSNSSIKELVILITLTFYKKPTAPSLIHTVQLPLFCVLLQNEPSLTPSPLSP